MKKTWLLNWLLIAAVVLGISMTVTSCKDDDDDEKELTEEQKEAQAAELAAKDEAFWSVVGQLTDTKSLPDNWENATFEPSYGEQDENDAFTRVVVVNTVAEAARLFSNIIEVDIDENTPTYTFQNDNVGTLTYKRTADGKSMATVDVSIRQMPHLQKIVYKTPDQLGTNTLFNGNFDGGAYYRFGDVVKKANKDGKPEYWICVRPAFSRESKGDSHWVTLSALPEENLFHYRASNGFDYYLPKDLGVNTTHEKNFAEMLYAVLNPEQWQKNIEDNPRLDMFNGFDHDDIDFHNACFWKLVATGWKENQIMNCCFGGLSMDVLRQSVNADGLTLIYDSKWNTFFSWSPTIYTRIYSGMNLKKSMKKAFSTSVKLNVDLNMRDNYYKSFGVNSGFFGDSKPRWIIRHATGEELGGHDDPKRPMDNGVEEVYVFNKYFYANRDLSDDDELLEDYVNTTHGLYLPGDVVKDPSGNRWICVQTAFRDDTQEPSLYSYFISFDPGALRIGNDPMGNLPSCNLAWQMLFDMICHFSMSTIYSAQSATLETINSFKDNCEIDLNELIGIHFFEAEGHPFPVKVYCTSALYNGGDNGKCIARLIYDMSPLQSDGARDLGYYAFDEYTTEPARKMMLNDLYDQKVVNQYKVDTNWGDKRWYVPPYKGMDTEWVPSHPREFAITQTGLDSWYTSPSFKFIHDYGDQRPGYNMYTEPVMAFAVKRVADDGAIDNHLFEDGTRILKYKNVNERLFREQYLDLGYLSYHGMANGFYINGNPGFFGIKNEK